MMKAQLPGDQGQSQGQAQPAAHCPEQQSFISTWPRPWLTQAAVCSVGRTGAWQPGELPTRPEIVTVCVAFTLLDPDPGMVGDQGTPPGW